MIESEILYEIIKKCNGPIEPAGDSSVDDNRLKNLENLIDLADKILCDIEMVASGQDSQFGSIAKAGRVADEFLREIRQE